MTGDSLGIPAATLTILFGLAINTFVIMGFGWKISRFLARIEMKVDIMWAQYSRQTRATDSANDDSLNGDSKNARN